MAREKSSRREKFSKLSEWSQIVTLKEKPMTEEENLLLSVQNHKDAERVGKILGIAWRTVYQRRRDLMTRIKIEELEKPQEKVNLTNEIRNILKSKVQVSVIELSNKFNVGIDKITEALNEIEGEGYLIDVVDDKVSLGKSIKPPEPAVIPIEPFFNNWIKFGVVSDTHLNSKYERLDVLYNLYDIFKREGIKNVFHAGNMIDGFARFNQFDVFNTGVNEQVEYWCAKYPYREGITTHFITGDDHEGWYVQREHINIGQVMEDTAKYHYGREDLHHLGYIEANVEIPIGKRKTVIRIMHPGGGTAYAMSYQPQKIVESLQGGEKPDFLIIGHYHKAESGIIRNVPYIQAGCTEDQTPFMRKKHIKAHIGGWIVELQIAPEGYVNRIKTEWIRYFDKKFYKENRDIQKLPKKDWKYQW